MKKYIILITILLTLNTMLNAQDKKQAEPINNSDILSYDQFQEIKQFVLDKEQTRTYCNMYNDNPYYEFRDGNNDRIDLYLDPIFQFLKKEDLSNPEMYNKITLYAKFTTKERGSYDYIHLSQDKESKEVYLIPHWETKEGLKQKEKQLKISIQCILKEIKENSN